MYEYKLKFVKAKENVLIQGLKTPKASTPFQKLYQQTTETLIYSKYTATSSSAVSFQCITRKLQVSSFPKEFARTVRSKCLFCFKRNMKKDWIVGVKY